MNTRLMSKQLKYYKSCKFIVNTTIPLVVTIQSNMYATLSQELLPCVAFQKCTMQILVEFVAWGVVAWGVGGTLVESTPFIRRVMGSTPALAAT